MKKKILAALCAASMLFGSSAFAFDFPEPDWGALLAEKREMAEKTEFDLYTEGNPDAAPYFGARLEPRSGTYLGMIAENADSFLPLGSYLTYFDDMNQDDIYYPANQMIRDGSAVVTIGWTIHSLDNVNYDKIRSVLDTLNGYQKPMFIRFANEMNVSPLGDDPDRYIEVFRKVADMVHEYPNFAVVWSPNDMGALDRPFHYFYPGDSYVDWIGISSYMKKYFQGSQNTDDKSAAYFMTGDYAWATNAVKPILKFMQDYDIQKPLMISEGGVATNNQYGEDMTAWASPRLRNMYWYLVMKYPQIKLINNFNTHRENEAERFDISDYPFAADIFREASACGAYLHAANDTADFVFQKADDGAVLSAKDGKVSLYTLCYVLREPNLSVHYYVDSNWTHAADQIPYRYDMDISSMANGTHTLTIRTGFLEKTYSFYKKGNQIRFGAEIENTITVMLNGSPIDFDQPPIIKDDRTLVPLRAIFEALGAAVSWDDATQTVTAVRGDKTVSLTIGSQTLYVGQSAVTLDVPAQLVNDRTLVPVRAISAAFDYQVDWDDELQQVSITD